MKKLVVIGALLSILYLESYSFTVNNDYNKTVDIEISLRFSSTILKGTVAQGAEITLTPPWYLSGFCMSGYKVIDHATKQVLKEMDISAGSAFYGAIFGTSSKNNLCQDMKLKVRELMALDKIE